MIRITTTPARGETARLGKHVADRPQHRLGDPEQEIADHGDELVARMTTLKATSHDSTAAAISSQM